MLNDVRTHKAHVAIQEIFPTIERQAVVDFTYQVTPQNIPKTILIKREKTYVEKKTVNWTFLKVMESDIIALVPVITTVVLLTIFTLENIESKVASNRRYKLRESFSYINGILYQRDLGKFINIDPPGWVVSCPPHFLLQNVYFLAFFTLQNCKFGSSLDLIGGLRRP